MSRHHGTFRIFFFFFPNPKIQSTFPPVVSKFASRREARRLGAVPGRCAAVWRLLVSDRWTRHIPHAGVASEVGALGRCEVNRNAACDAARLPEAFASPRSRRPWRPRLWRESRIKPAVKIALCRCRRVFGSPARRVGDTSPCGRRPVPPGPGRQRGLAGGCPDPGAAQRSGFPSWVSGPTPGQSRLKRDPLALTTTSPLKPRGAPAVHGQQDGPL